MSFVKELLLSILTVTSVIFVVSQPIQRDPNRFFALSLCNLKKAEHYCVHLFGEPPKAYTDKTLELIDGITFPVGNTSDPKTRESMCSINYYLKHHLPEITKSLTLNASKITVNARMFQTKFEKRVNQTYQSEPVDLEGCSRQKPAITDYAKKEFVLRIIYFSRKWTEEFFGIETCKNL